MQRNGTLSIEQLPVVLDIGKNKNENENVKRHLTG